MEEEEYGVIASPSQILPARASLSCCLTPSHERIDSAVFFCFVLFFSAVYLTLEAKLANWIAAERD